MAINREIDPFESVPRDRISQDPIMRNLELVHEVKTRTIALAHELVYEPNEHDILVVENAFIKGMEYALEHVGRRFDLLTSRA